MATPGRPASVPTDLIAVIVWTLGSGVCPINGAGVVSFLLHADRGGYTGAQKGGKVAGGRHPGLTRASPGYNP